MNSLPRRAAPTIAVTGIIEEERNAPNPCPKPTKRARKAKNPPIDKAAYLEFRHQMGFGMLCDCGCGQLGTTIHHCIIGRHKGHPELDNYRNYALVNMWEDSTRKFDNRKWRAFFYRLNEKRFYRDVFWLWIESLPDGMRRRVDELRCKE